MDQPVSADVAIYRIPSPSIVQDEELKRFENEIFAIIRRGRDVKLAIDFSRTFHVSSRALGLLVAFRKEVRERGGRMVLFGINPAIEKVMEVTRLNTLIRVAKDETRALQELRTSGDDGRS